jgi:hypothetical protein
VFFIVFPYGRQFSLSKCAGKNDIPKDHTLALALGFVAGCAIVWWVRQCIASDAVFAMVISTFLFFIIREILKFCWKGSLKV